MEARSSRGRDMSISVEKTKNEGVDCDFSRSLFFFRRFFGEKKSERKRFFPLRKLAPAFTLLPLALSHRAPLSASIESQQAARASAGTGKGHARAARKEKASSFLLFFAFSLPPGFRRPSLFARRARRASGQQREKKKQKKNMHVLGLNRTSGYNIPAAAAAAAAATDGGVDGPPPPAARTTRIGRYEIVSKKDLKKHSLDKKGGGGAGASSSSSLALERWVCEFSPSFFSEGGREASVVTVLRPPEGEAAARQPGGPRKPGGVVVVSPVFPRGGGGGGIAGAGGGATTAATAAATTTGTKETTLSAGQTAVVHPGDTLFFPGCPRSLVGLRVLPGAAERDAQELERRELEEGKKKKPAAAAAVAGKKRERAANATATTATATAANSLPLRMQPEPLDRWHFSFLNARFAGRVEQRLRDAGASVSTLLPPSADAGTTGSLAEDAYLSLFPAAPLLIYGEDAAAATPPLLPRRGRRGGGAGREGALFRTGTADAALSRDPPAAVCCRRRSRCCRREGLCRRHRRGGQDLS